MKFSLFPVEQLEVGVRGSLKPEFSIAGAGISEQHPRTALKALRSNLNDSASAAVIESTILDIQHHV
jgi:hypothetical protein